MKTIPLLRTRSGISFLAFRSLLSVKNKQTHSIKNRIRLGFQIFQTRGEEEKRKLPGGEWRLVRVDVFLFFLLDRSEGSGESIGC
jgi:hypothetical protein